MPTISKQRRALVQAFADVLRGTGNWLVSTPGAQHLRFEVVQGSSLAQAFMDAGHTLVAHGQGERIEPIVTTETITDPKTKVITKVRHGGFVKTEVWEIALPVDRSR
jgi:hypothetical protein